MAGSAAIFHHYELFLTSLFPTPYCPELIFNIPNEFQSQFFLKFPCVLAVLLDTYIVMPVLCVQLIHNDNSPAMPISFQDPLHLFGKLFTTKVSTRAKRGSGSLDNFMMWGFGDTPKLVYDLETVEMCHLVKINKLIDQTKDTTLSINQNSKELADIYSDLRNDEILLKDLTLKSDLVNIFNSLHHTYLNYVGRLTDFQASHSALLLEFELSIQTDSRKIYNCILNAPFCFSKHGLFYCTRN